MIKLLSIIQCSIHPSATSHPSRLTCNKLHPHRRTLKSSPKRDDGDCDDDDFDYDDINLTAIHCTWPKVTQD